MKTRIAISQRIINFNKNRLGDFLEHRYIILFAKVSTVIPIPNYVVDVERYLKENNITHIILSGGGGIDLNRIKLENYRSCQRDLTESKCLEYAEQKNIPILGICRGSEIINLFFGGRLIKESEKRTSFLDHAGTRHSITIIDKNLFQQVGNLATEVNSYHDELMTTNGLSPTCQPFALAEDQTVEGFHHNSLPIVGIMWHPEREKTLTPLNAFLLNSFLERKTFWA